MFAHPSRALRPTALAVAVGALALLMIGVPAEPAWSAPTGPGRSVPPGCGGATPQALADFFDGAVPGRLTEDRVPGAVVSVVSGGATAFAQGYGRADVERGVAFDAQRSLVRIGSVTKLFTWTAVMQLVQAGRLDLDADVNTYLTDVRIPSTYPGPVTLRSLMNHTAGFEERIIGTAARTAEDVPPLAEFLAANQPARIRPVGEVSAYSNYGAALAGHIVAEVSGEPYDVYVGRHLLDPLGMTHSTATEPVPAGLAADLAGSYDSEASPPRRIPFTYDVMAPDGSISATAADMANFMSAHLNQGGFSSTAILDAATTARMHQRSFAADPRLSGWAHGFIDRVISGRRVLMHDGSWEGFLSALVLVPGCDLGLFVSTNGTGGVATITQLVRSFVDRFAPAPATPEVAPASTTTPGVSVAAPLAGFYQPARHNGSTVEKLVSLLGPARLTVADDGSVRFRGQQWSARGDGFFTAADGTDHLVFLAGPDGRRYVATDGPTYQLMPASETPMLNLVVVLGFMVAALSVFVVAVVWLVRRLARRPVTTTTPWRFARGLAAGAALVGVVFVVALGAVLFGDTSEFLYGVPVSFRLLMLLPLAMLVLVGAAATCTVAGWPGRSVVARVHQVIVLVGLAALAWFVWQWNLVGWDF
jgi:CubicO group peptidase (beta-lactamase class C family)